MKSPVLILGSLDLQVAFHFPRSKTIYRTLTYASRLANPSYGNRACIDLNTNKVVNLLCNQPVVINKKPPVPQAGSNKGSAKVATFPI